MPDFRQQIYTESVIQDGVRMMPQARYFTPMKLDSVAYNGKPCGGLWTSTRLARGYSDWIAYCVQYMPSWLGNRWVLDVRSDARVLHVVTRADVAALPTVPAKKQINCNSDGRAIDWVELSRSFDGVRIVNPDYAYRFSADFASECTFWFRWSFDAVALDMAGRAIERGSFDSYSGKPWPKRFGHFAS